MKRSFQHNGFGFILMVLGVCLATTPSNAQWKLFAVTGQLADTNTVAGGAFRYPDHTLFEVNPANAAMTKLSTLSWVPGTDAIGFNPDNQLLYHTAGSDAFTSDPTATGNDQGGPNVAGVGYQDSQYMETVNAATGAMAAIFNADPCPNPDSALPCFGLTAAQPTWILPTGRRTSAQTGPEFLQTGDNEYDSARGLAWSKEKKLFYVADELGIFTLTPTGESTWIGRPFFSDGQADESYSIAFVSTNLYVGHRSAGAIMRIDPEFADGLEEIQLTPPPGGGAPAGTFGGVLGLAAHPDTGVLYGVRATTDPFARELVTINPTNGTTTLIGNLGAHVTSIAFGTSSAMTSEIRVAITNQTATTITLSWTGGPGRYLVQKKIDLGAANWFDVVSTTEQSATVPKDAQMGFYRIVGNYTGPDVMP